MVPKLRYATIEIFCSKCCSNKKKIKSILKQIPSQIGVKRLGEPKVYSFPRMHGQKIAGVTGHVTIAESNIDVHTYPEHAYCEWIAVTCGNANFRRAIPYLKKTCPCIKTIKFSILKKCKNKKIK